MQLHIQTLIQSTPTFLSSISSHASVQSCSMPSHVRLTHIPTEWTTCMYRLNFNLSKEKGIKHHSQKEHNEMSKIAKFGCEML
jgi:hypothetical protein